MNHREVQKGLADYLEGDLPLSTRARVDAHLEACPDCAREVRELQQTIRLLRGMPEPEPPPMIAANVMRRIRAGETQPGPFGRFTRLLAGILEPAFVLPASAVAVAGLVVMVFQGPGLSGLDLGPFASSSPSAGGPSRTAATSVPGAIRGDVLRLGPASASPQRIASAPLAPRSAASTAAAHRAPAAAVAVPLASASSASPARERRPQAGVPLPFPWLQAAPDGSQGAGGRSFLADGPMRVARSEGAWPMLVSDRLGGIGSARPVAQPQRVDVGSFLSGHRPQRAGIEGTHAAAHEDARDVWLARAFDDPVAFARYIAGQSLAEQELWVARLAERAVTRGLLAELVDVLRVSGDEGARWLADDFAAAASGRSADASSGEAPR